MLVTKIDTQKQNNPKFGKRIPTKLVEDAKRTLRFNNGFIELKNGDIVSSVLGNNTLVIKKPLPSPDNLVRETVVRLKKGFFGGFKVDSAHLGMTHLPHRFGNGLVVKPLGETNCKQAAKETQEVLERVVKEDSASQVIDCLQKQLQKAQKIISNF